MSNVRGAELWRYRRAHGIAHPLSGRKIFGLTPAEKRQEQSERRYRLRLASLVLVGAITPEEHRQAVARLDRAARRRNGIY